MSRLFEAHLLRQAFETMAAVRDADASEIRDALDALVRDQPRLANEVVSIGIPILTGRVDSLGRRTRRSLRALTRRGSETGRPFCRIVTTRLRRRSADGE
jgi:hypothetical protein